MIDDPHPGQVCITCSDQAIPVVVLELLGDDLALVDTGAGPGTEEEISIALVDAVVGDTVLVHAGEAIARVDAATAVPRVDAGDVIARLSRGEAAVLPGRA